MKLSHSLNEKVDLNNFYWINEPVNFRLNCDDLVI